MATTCIVYFRIPIVYTSRIVITDLIYFAEINLTRPTSGFRFEDYDPEKLPSAAAAAGAAKADLYRLFPSGTEVRPFVELIQSIGGNCYETQQFDPAPVLICNYTYPKWKILTKWMEIVRIGIHWTVYVFQDETGKSIDKFRVDVVGRS